MFKFVCEVCHKSYNHRSNLVEHKKYECQNTNQFRCSECSKSCSRWENLKTHMKRRHGMFHFDNKMNYMFKF